jgi:hypothetical protein
VESFRYSSPHSAPLQILPAVEFGNDSKSSLRSDLSHCRRVAFGSPPPPHQHCKSLASLGFNAKLTRRKPPILVVELNLDISAHRRSSRSSSYSTPVVEECLSFFTGEGGVGVGEDETDGGEEVGFAGSVAADEEVQAGATRGEVGEPRVV